MAHTLAQAARYILCDGFRPLLRRRIRMVCGERVCMCPPSAVPLSIILDVVIQVFINTMKQWAAQEIHSHNSRHSMQHVTTTHGVVQQQRQQNLCRILFFFIIIYLSFLVFFYGFVRVCFAVLMWITVCCSDSWTTCVNFKRFWLMSDRSCTAAIHSRFG